MTIRDLLLIALGVGIAAVGLTLVILTRETWAQWLQVGRNRRYIRSVK